MPALRVLLPFGVLVAVGAPAIEPANAASTERVSINSAEQQATNDTSGFAFGSYSTVRAISADGRFVVFSSYATNLVTPDANGGDVADTFVRDRLLGTTERVNVSSAEVQGTHDGSHPIISSNGRFVVFNSYSKNLAPGDDPTPSVQLADVFVRDLQAGTTERVSVDSAEVLGDEDSQHPASISADGRYVAFPSYATNLVVSDNNGKIDVFVRDRTAGTTERVSVNSSEQQANGDSDVAVISPNGRFVAFSSKATNLVTPATNGLAHVFVRDRVAGTTELISVDSSEARANNNNIVTGISADGRFVAFSSPATNLVASDTNAKADVFVRDRLNGTTERVSVNSAEAQGNGDSANPTLSDDGRFVSFSSYATNLVAGDTNNYIDSFVRDRLSGTTERVNVSTAGAQANHPASISLPPASAISANGRFVAFTSDATTLVPNDTNALDDIFLRDRGPVAENRQFVAGDFDGNNRDDLVGDFGARGLWVLPGGATAWVRLHSADPGGFASGDFDASGRDDLAVDFDATGLWTRYNNATWTRLHTGNAEGLAAANFDANVRSDLLADFGTSGLWARYNNAATLTRLHSGNVEGLTAGDLDGNGRAEPIADFGAVGIWAFVNNTSWSRLHTANPENLKSGDLDGGNRDDVIADLGAGLAARYNNTTTWTTLHSGNIEGLAIGDFDGGGKDDLAADFGAVGLWVRLNNATWSRLHTANAEALATGDFDGNGKVDLVVDFGASGIFVRYNNATWAVLPALPAATAVAASGH
jgi:hypothetical protein